MVAGTAKYQKFRETAKQYNVMSSSHSISCVTFQDWYGNYGTGGSDLEVLTLTFDSAITLSRVWCPITIDKPSGFHGYRLKMCITCTLILTVCSDVN